MLVRTRTGGNVLIEFRYGSRREEIAQLLESQSIQYNDKYKHFIFSMSIKRALEEQELFLSIAKLNSGWWADSNDGD